MMQADITRNDIFFASLAWYDS